MKSFRYLLVLSAVIMLVHSCRKAFDRPEWDVNVLAPIIKSKLDFRNLLADSMLKTNPDNSLTLVYNNNFYGLTLDSLIKIPDTTIRNFYNLPVGSIQVMPGGNIATTTQSTQYNLQGVQLTRAVIRSGSMNVQLKSYIKGKTRITYQIPGATLNSVPFQVVEMVPACVGAIPGVLNKSYDLKGYNIDLRGPLLNSFNTLTTVMIADIDPSEPQPVNIFPGDSVVISNGFTKIVPQYAKGYFGQGAYNVTDTSSFDIFRHIVGGSLLLDSVDVKLKIENSVGADARVRISSLRSLNSRTGNSIALNHTIIGSPVNVNRAFDANGTVIPSVYSVQLNNSNSNIKPMLENLPDKIAYSLNADINPLGNVSGGNDFIYYGSGLRINLNMEVPLWFASNRLTLVDTLAYSIAPNNQNIQDGTLYLLADNGFPFEASVQLYILNNNNAVVDSLMPAINTIDEGVVNSSYIVTQSRSTRLEIPVSAAKINRLYANKKIYVKVRLNTYGYPNYMKIYSYYNISLKLIGDINYHVASH